MRKQKLILPLGLFSPWFAVILCLEARLHRALQRDGDGEGVGSGGSLGAGRCLRFVSFPSSAQPVAPSLPGLFPGEFAPGSSHCPLGGIKGKEISSEDQSSLGAKPGFHFYADGRLLLLGGEAGLWLNR